MQQIDTASFKLSPLGSLIAGQTFYLFEDGQLSLHVIPDVSDPRHVVTMALSGPQAFLLTKRSRIGSSGVLPTGIAPARMRLRLDMASARFSVKEHLVGNVAVGGNAGGPRITTAWVGDSPADVEYSKHGLVLDSWEYVSAENPVYLFERWAWSYVDDAGQWVDLVNRDGVLQEA